jgi:hypothetical protein
MPYLSLKPRKNSKENIMSISADEILGKITDAAEGAFEDGWQAVKKYAPAEFKKDACPVGRNR